LALPESTPPDVATSLRAYRLSIDANDRFDLFAGGISMSGRIHVSGAEATLEPDTYMGRPLNRQPEGVKQIDRSAKLKGNADGTITLQQLQSEPVVLKRESQPAG
jgi:hypothetical protein